MKTYASIVALSLVAAASAGCLQPGSDSPIRILGAQTLEFGGDPGVCTTGELELMAGSLDVAGSTAYVAAFNTMSTLQRLSTTVGGETVAGPDRNDFIADEIFLSYTSTPDLSFEQERLPIHARIEAGANDGKLFIDLLGPKASLKLLDNVAPGDQILLVASFELRGSLASGQRIRSNTVKFPITVLNSGFAGCAPGVARVLNGPCGGPGGQDGSLAGCCDDPNFSDSCSGQ